MGIEGFAFLAACCCVRREDDINFAADLALLRGAQFDQAYLHSSILNDVLSLKISKLAQPLTESVITYRISGRGSIR